MAINVVQRDRFQSHGIARLSLAEHFNIFIWVMGVGGGGNGYELFMLWGKCDKSHRLYYIYVLYLIIRI